jgi:hypothetical protein
MIFFKFDGRGSSQILLEMSMNEFFKMFQVLFFLKGIIKKIEGYAKDVKYRGSHRTIAAI